MVVVKAAGGTLAGVAAAPMWYGAVWRHGDVRWARRTAAGHGESLFPPPGSQGSSDSPGLRLRSP